MKADTLIAIRKILYYTQNYKFSGRRLTGKFKMFNEHCLHHGGVSELFLRRSGIKSSTITALLKARYVCAATDEKYQLAKYDRCLLPTHKMREIKIPDNLKEYELKELLKNFNTL